ncbi:Ribonucleotide reductase of class Ia (aerobic), beta subunit [Natrarchaeobaculum sulfurireducens]|uniref:Ribonucleotide reductase of class Ia (Aerobic), beta subunit n=1 Tax=Natrarchaeobaculum sulfurireducens TaxID=2044521 RepID=A0A346PTH1_9EURY|nr:Ribonucleotide reductase, beta subunit [Natrarchaeobaculum sulfurireducens]AXR82816.1 Ribonucleotide reductase of class Ia (aerobic), beta subunit [Natrarchaeobaculum sulfurireducens]
MDAVTETQTDIFEERTQLKPYEYPELLDYVEAIRNSYWVHTEFNFEGDVQDYKVNTTPAEKTVIKRTMLAIAQIEVQVKTFWSDIYKQMPKPEIGSVGMTFADSEVRHMDAYSHLLDVLGITEDFKQVTEEPAIKQRIDYLNEYLERGQTDDRKEYVMSILLFSTFVEHVSLFSQFLIMTSFDKHEKKFKGIANAVEATSKEEQIHGLFGVELVETIREENPGLFDEDFEADVKQACEQAYEAEMEILDWIFEEGELEFLPREHVNAYLRDRFNQGLENVGVEPIFEPDEALLEETRWFDEDIMMTKDNDFFSKRSTTYNKHTQSVTAEDMF